VTAGPTFVVVVDVPEREDRLYVFARSEDALAFGDVLTSRGTYHISHREPVIDRAAADLLIQAERAR
jgi:hypothetical protein